MYCVWSRFKDELDPGQKSVTSYNYSGHQLNIIMVKKYVKFTTLEKRIRRWA